MAFLSAPFTSAPTPAVMDPPSFAQHGLSEGLVTSSALPPALGRSLIASNSLPAAFPRQLASFPMASPALSVMIPTATGTGLQTSPRASQVYTFTSQKVLKSLLVHIPAQAAQLFEMLHHWDINNASAVRSTDFAGDARHSISAGCTGRSGPSCCQSSCGSSCGKPWNESRLDTQHAGMATQVEVKYAILDH